VQGHFELFPERLVLSGEQFVHLAPCLLKKLKQKDSSKFKFGLKLEKFPRLSCDLFSDSADQAQVWFDHLKRLALSTKFTKKHKMHQKVKSVEGNYFRCYK
jgi:hypothetical protein